MVDTNISSNSMAEKKQKFPRISINLEKPTTFGVINKLNHSIQNPASSPTVMRKESLFNTKGEFRKCIGHVPPNKMLKKYGNEYSEIFIGTREQVNRMRIKMLTSPVEHLDGRPYYYYYGKIAEYRHTKLFLSANSYPASKRDDRQIDIRHHGREDVCETTRLSVVKELKNAFFISRERSEQSVRKVTSEYKKTSARR